MSACGSPHLPPVAPCVPAGRCRVRGGPDHALGAADTGLHQPVPGHGAAVPPQPALAHALAWPVRPAAGHATGHRPQAPPDETRGRGESNGVLCAGRPPEQRSLRDAAADAGPDGRRRWQRWGRPVQLHVPDEPAHAWGATAAALHPAHPAAAAAAAPDAEAPPAPPDAAAADAPPAHPAADAASAFPAPPAAAAATAPHAGAAAGAALPAHAAAAGPAAEPRPDAPLLLLLLCSAARRRPAACPPGRPGHHHLQPLPGDAAHARGRRPKAAADRRQDGKDMTAEAPPFVTSFCFLVFFFCRVHSLSVFLPCQRSPPRP